MVDQRVTSPARLRLSHDALISNWQWLAKTSGAAACGAAIKANGYGLGALEVMARLQKAGCRDFFVATWAEAQQVEQELTGQATLSVLHGVRPDDMIAALSSRARPVLSSPEQIARWREATDLPCDVMVDTGMNRLGVSCMDALSGLLDGLNIQTIMSHLASADEDCPQNDVQRTQFAAVQAAFPDARASLANSAGICLGASFHLDLTRPGLSIYGGIARPEAQGNIRQLVMPEAEILQIRTVRAGEPVGYNATWRAPREQRIAIVNLGYADGYSRAFSDVGSARFQDANLKVIGRVSMDLIALALPEGCAARSGDFVRFDFDLSEMSRRTGVSPYELLTSLGSRYDRIWV